MKIFTPTLFDFPTPPGVKPARRGARLTPTGAARAALGDACWSITFPAPGPMLSINGDGKHWRVVSKHKRTLRDLMLGLARAHRLPTGLDRARVDIELRFPRGARRDTANYQPYMAKPLVDALGPGRTYTIRQGKRRGTVVDEPGYGLLVGDDVAHLHCSDCPHIRFGTPVGAPNPRLPYGEITVTIAAVTEAVTP